MDVLQTLVSTRTELGGPSRSVPALCDALAEYCNSRLLTSVPASGKEDVCILPSDRARLLSIVEPTGILKEPNLAVGFRRALQRLDLSNVVVHDHGIWKAVNHQIAVHCKKNRVIRVVSPRGMLAPWALKSKLWKKKLGWWLFQHSDLKQATAFHATSEQEASEIRQLGFRQRIEVVPNGIAFPADLPAEDGSKRVLFLSRVDPKKGVDLLLHAWGNIRPAKPWELQIVGPGDLDYLKSLQKLCIQLQIQDSVTFKPECAESEKWQYYANADIFILPSHNENFGNVIAKAMVAGLPVITTIGTPWRVIEEQGLGWWVNADVLAIESAIRSALISPKDQLVKKGMIASRYIKDNFSWAKTALVMAEFYKEIVV